MTTTTPRRAGAPPMPELVRALLEDASSGLLLIDPRGRLAEANPTAVRLLGLPAGRRPAGNAAGLLRTVVAGDDPVAEAFRRARQDRIAVLHTREGGELPVRLRSYRFGRPAWVLVTLEDLTQMRRMQQELRRHERLATLGQLSAGVAHEIRNPLAGIGTSAQVLLRRFEPRDDRARFVQVILDEVARLDRIVTSLLQYARPRAPELKASQLADCVARVIDVARPQTESAGIEVEVHVAPRLAAVYIDPDLIQQVLLNVSLNAIQAMPKGGTLRYEVRLSRRRAPVRGGGLDRLPAGARDGHRHRHPAWHHAEDVRPVLHHQGHRHRPRSQHLPDHHAGARRVHRRGQPRGPRYDGAPELPRGEATWRKTPARRARRSRTRC